MSKKIFILSGPAGVGKTTLWRSVAPHISHVKKVITTTTRLPRNKEINGEDYHFITKQQFEQKIKNNDLIEYAIVHTNYYGSTRSELEKIIGQGYSPLYIIEPQGMIHLKPLLEQEGYVVVTIFILPPSVDELKKRLKKRGTESKEQFEIRLATAMQELEQQDFYDIKIVNADLETTTKDFINILS